MNGLKTVSESEVSTGMHELKDEESGCHEFWIGDVKGKAVTIHFGKVGTQGHRGSREFKTSEAAREFLNKRLQQKLEEGYKQI